MDAIILAAGFATRLRPLSLVRPKVLVPICGTPLLNILVNHLKSRGFKNIHINTHHLANQIESHIKNENHSNMVKTYHEPEILGTGGGIFAILNKTPYMEDSVLVINGDILAGIDLKEVWEWHHEVGAAVTMVMTDLAEYNNVLVDQDFCILDFVHDKTNVISGHRSHRFVAFTGIHMVNKEVITRYSPNKKFFSILETYRNAIRAGQKVKALYFPEMSWHEVGSIHGYREVHKKLINNPNEFAPWISSVTFPSIDRSASVHPTAVFENVVCVGKQTSVGANTYLKDTILWDNVRVREGIRLENVIVGDHCTVDRSCSNSIIVEK